MLFFKKLFWAFHLYLLFIYSSYSYIMQKKKLWLAVIKKTLYKMQSTTSPIKTSSHQGTLKGYDES